jgi:hypothetical protein
VWVDRARQQKTLGKSLDAAVVLIVAGGAGGEAVAAAASSLSTSSLADLLIVSSCELQQVERVDWGAVASHPLLVLLSNTLAWPTLRTHRRLQTVAEADASVKLEGGQVHHRFGVTLPDGDVVDVGVAIDVAHGAKCVRCWKVVGCVAETGLCSRCDAVAAAHSADSKR